VREAIALVRTDLHLAGTQYALSLLVGANRMFEVLCDPALNEEQALAAARSAQSVDGAIDVALARSLAQTMVTSEGPLNVCQAGRLMGILEAISDGVRILPSLVRLLRHSDERVRSKAVLMIGRGKRSVQWVRERLDESDARIRANALEALWDVHTEEARQLLHRMLRDCNNRVVGNAVLGLYLLGDSSVIPEMPKLASHDSPLFRATAAWVMGETGDPRFIEHLANMMKEPNAGVRKRAFAGLARLKALMAEATQAPRCRLAARWLPPDAHNCQRRLSVAISGAPALTSERILPTHFAIAEEGRAVLVYKVNERPLADMLSIAFLLPADDTPAAARWPKHLAALLPDKRPADLWGSGHFLPQSVERGSPADGDNVTFHSTRDAIAGQAARHPAPAECSSVWRALWHAIRGRGGATGGAQRRIILFNHSRVAGAAGAELVLSAEAARISVQVISLCPEPALEEFCRKTAGNFALAGDPGQISELLSNAYLSLFPRYEINYPPVVPQACTARLRLRSPAGFGETTLAAEAASAPG
jgi:HEAT repeat protein